MLKIKVFKIIMRTNNKKQKLIQKEKKMKKKIQKRNIKNYQNKSKVKIKLNAPNIVKITLMIIFLSLKILKITTIKNNQTNFKALVMSKRRIIKMKMTKIKYQEKNYKS